MAILQLLSGAVKHLPHTELREPSYLHDVNDPQVRIFWRGVLSLHEDQGHLIPLKNQNNTPAVRTCADTVLSVLFDAGLGPVP